MIGKEIVNVYDGSRMGTISDSDLIIDPETGTIESIILPARFNFINFWIDRHEMVVPGKLLKRLEMRSSL